MRLEGAHVLLTGATGGIGQYLAKQLQQKGASLTLTGRDQTKLSALAELLAARGPCPQVVAADLTRPEGIQAIVEAVSGEGRRCDILINNAGRVHFGNFQDQSAEDIQALYQTNLIAPVLLMRALLPGFLARESGLMLCMGSALGAIGYPFHSNASSCKFGLRGFCQALRRELSGSGVGIAYVAPRTTRTGMNSEIMLDMARELGNAVDEPEEVAEVVIEVIEKDLPERIIGKPERVFSKLNALFPSLVDRAISRQHAQMQRYATKHLNIVKESDIIKKP